MKTIQQYKLYLVFAAFSLSLLGAGGRATAAADIKRFAIVVGYNKSANPKLKDLRYGDDDAVQNAQLMTQFGAKVDILTELDADSSVIYEKSQSYLAPTLKNLSDSFAAMNREMKRAKAEGHRPVLYFFFSGHGDVERNEGIVYFKDGKLKRSELIRFLKNSEAFSNHIIIDACKSYFMVFSRGAGGKRKRIDMKFSFGNEELPANTGVLLSTSSMTESHEWEAYQGGIFTHELRSAMRGAADLDQNRTISYREASAFIWNANSTIRNKKYRPNFFAYQPASEEAASLGLISSQLVKKPIMTIGPQLSGHFYIEDRMGVRFADLHTSGGTELSIVLPPQRPLYLRRSESNEEMMLTAEIENIRIERPHWQTRTVAARGAEHEAFSLLFSQPFTMASVASFQKDLIDNYTNSQQSSPLEIARQGVAIGGTTFLATSGVYYYMAKKEERRVTPDTSNLETISSNRKIENQIRMSRVMLGLSAAAFGTYLAWDYIFDDDNTITIMPNLITPEIGVQIRLR
jgi:hypothetical protein